jgi:hypothetical protein
MILPICRGLRLGEEGNYKDQVCLANITSAEPIHDCEDGEGGRNETRCRNSLPPAKSSGFHLDPPLPISRLPATFSLQDDRHRCPEISDTRH